MGTCSVYRSYTSCTNHLPAPNVPDPLPWCPYGYYGSHMDTDATARRSTVIVNFKYPSAREIDAIAQSASGLGPDVTCYEVADTAYRAGVEAVSALLLTQEEARVLVSGAPGWSAALWDKLRRIAGDS
jgi:hypothetical protein